MQNSTAQPLSYLTTMARLATYLATKPLKPKLSSHWNLSQLTTRLNYKANTAQQTGPIHGRQSNTRLHGTSPKYTIGQGPPVNNHYS